MRWQERTIIFVYDDEIACNLFGVKPTEDAKLEASLNVEGLVYMITGSYFIVGLYVPCYNIYYSMPTLPLCFCLPPRI